MLSHSSHILVARERQCTRVSEECAVTSSFYGYAPSYPPNAILLALFGLAFIIHTVQGLYFRTWGILVAFSLGCLCEVIGYGGRIMMHANAYDLNGFLLQICCISLAPAFFSAAIYFCLSRIVSLYGESFARIKAKNYTYIFIFCDIVSLALQGAGGGLASVAAQNDSDPSTGNNVMMAGLSFQVFSLVLFATATADYYFHARKHYRNGAPPPPSPPKGAHPRIKWFFLALTLAFTCIMIRCIYRVIELSDGWNSALMKDEVLYVVLEGIMIIIAVFLLNLFYPGQYVLTRHKDGFKHDNLDSSKAEAGL